MEKLKYNGVEFTIKANRLAVSQYLLPLTIKYRNAEREATKRIRSNPDYVRFSALQGEVMEVQAELERVSKLEANNEPEEKSKQETIKQVKEALKLAESRLDEPVLVDIAQEYADIIWGLRLQFTSDIENSKQLAMALLDGDISVIDYNNPTDEFWELQDVLTEVFFSTEQQTRLRNLRL